MKSNVLNLKIGIIGLGYVGLPLLIEFSKKYKVRGYDINKKRISEIIKRKDSFNEYKLKNNLNYKNVFLTNNYNELKDIDIFIVTVPTPITSNKKPDLRPLKIASKNIGNIMKKNAIVVYESTVYPGATEEVCVPILEKYSLKKYNKEFFCGYSPERINPGDKRHQLKNITKIVSGSNKKTLNIVDKLYSSIIKAGTYRVSNIKTAEAAKIIENTQRDINIALMNELSIIFNKLQLNTEEILDAASSKWNFNRYDPGLVGGHCISVDPYYLVSKAKEIGYTPKIISSGRKINDGMAEYVFKRIKIHLKRENDNLKSKKVCIFGITFKEDCSDVRNTQVIKIVNKFKKNGSVVHVYDPVADNDNVRKELSIRLRKNLVKNYYDIIILAVPHKVFRNLGVKKIKSFMKKKSILYDLKWMFKSDYSDLR